MTGNVALSERSVFHGRMEQLSLELLADETYRRAGFDPSVPACTMRLASTLWRDPAAVQVAPATVLRRSSAVLARVHGQRRIYIRRGCAPQDFRFLVGHELAHAVYADEGVTFATEDAEESACDALAGPWSRHGTPSERRSPSLGMTSNRWRSRSAQPSRSVCSGLGK